VAAIRELHKIKRQNPNLDINLYLHKISSAFRRFVLDTLAKLDVEHQHNQMLNFSNASNFSGTSSNLVSNSVGADENENVNLVVPSGDSDIGKVKNDFQSIRDGNTNSITTMQSILKSRSGKLVNNNSRASPIPSGSFEDFAPNAVRTHSNNFAISNASNSSSKANEAMRILEGLKNRPNSYRYPSTPISVQGAPSLELPSEFNTPGTANKQILAQCNT